MTRQDEGCDVCGDQPPVDHVNERAAVCDVEIGRRSALDGLQLQPEMALAILSISEGGVEYVLDENGKC